MEQQFLRIRFANLPFTPNYDEVIYMEREYDEATNLAIIENYEFLKEKFAEYNKRFVYLPFLTKELQADEKFWKYRTPHQEVCNRELPTLSNDYMVKYIYHYGQRVNYSSPSFMIAVPYMDIVINDNKPIYYEGVPIQIDESVDIKEYLGYLVEQVSQYTPTLIEYQKYLKGERTSDVRLREIKDPDYLFEDDIKIMLEDVRLKVDQLRRSGISDVILSQLLFPKPPLSTLRITEDHRIFLPEYNNVEIHMTPIVKAVYFLFLRHPEGILFKELIDYRDELDMLYRSVKENKAMNEKLVGSFFDYVQVQRLCDPTDNSINEKCARIREAFLLNIHEDIAKDYIVTGKKGEPKRVNLPSDKIIWE